MMMPASAKLPAELLEAATEQLLDSSRRPPNIVGIGHGVKWTDNQPTGQDAILVMVEQKLDVPAKDRIPATIKGKKTDVVAVGSIFAQQMLGEREFLRSPSLKDLRGVPADGEPEPLRQPQRTLLRFHEDQQGAAASLAGTELEVDLQVLRSRARPARPGYSVGHPKVTAGTIGAAATDIMPGGTVNSPTPGVGIPTRYYLLSNNHVVANSNNATLGDPILQPGTFDGGTDPADRIGRLSRFVPITFEPSTPRSEHRNLVDAAIAEVEFHDLDRLIYWTGAPRGWYRKARLKVGDRLKKTGRTTNYTTGRVIATNATIDVNYGGGRVARFMDQVVTTSMSAGGDSGALVLTSAPGSQPGTEDDFVVGLLFAGSSQVTILNHYERVRSLLRIEVYP